MTILKDKIEEILERTYSGSEHIGEVYNNEATQELTALFEAHLKELYEGTKHEDKYCEAFKENGMHTCYCGKGFKLLGKQ